MTGVLTWGTLPLVLLATWIAVLLRAPRHQTRFFAVAILVCVLLLVAASLSRGEMLVLVLWWNGLGGLLALAVLRVLGLLGTIAFGLLRGRRFRW